jgi:5-methylcytosine-specific restriction endonuclease McrA
MTRIRNRICKGCGVSVPKKNTVSGRYCSFDCELKYPKKKNRCSPECSKQTLYLRDVTFQNGTTHRQQCCRLCTRSKYIPKAANQIHYKPDAFKKQSRIRENLYGDGFYSNEKWLRLRYQALIKYGKRCMVCGDMESQIHVDHIKPRSKYPELELEISNLQILCKACNLGKSNQDETDFRVNI